MVLSFSKVADAWAHTSCPSCGAQLDSSARFCGGCGRAVEAPRGLVGREVAGRYRIIAKLGEGGMGAVYHAEQISLKRRVALKVLRAELSASPALVRRFNAEAELAARLNHPNTVTLYDFGLDADGSLFIAMEYVEGTSLRHVVLREGALPTFRLIHIAQQVCASLADAHACGIIHRDLKPDNVMLYKQGRAVDAVKVLDFGIAKLRDEGNRDMTQAMTREGDLIGTPQYMAPEQIRGETVDARTDVYAMGVMLYEMAVGKLPFTGPTTMALLSKHLTERPVPVIECRPDLQLSPALSQLIDACMAKVPEARPPNMETLERELHMLQQAHGVPSGYPSNSGLPSQVPSQVPVGLPSPPPHSPPLSRAQADSSPSTPALGAQHSETTAAPPARRKRTALKAAIALAVIAALGSGAAYGISKYNASKEDENSSDDGDSDTGEEIVETSNTPTNYIPTSDATEEPTIGKGLTGPGMMGHGAQGTIDDQVAAIAEEFEALLDEVDLDEHSGDTIYRDGLFEYTVQIPAGFVGAGDGKGNAGFFGVHDGVQTIIEIYAWQAPNRFNDEQVAEEIEDQLSDLGFVVDNYEWIRAFGERVVTGEMHSELVPTRGHFLMHHDQGRVYFLHIYGQGRPSAKTRAFRESFLRNNFHP